MAHLLYRRFGHQSRPLTVFVKFVTFEHAFLQTKNSEVLVQNSPMCFAHKLAPFLVI